jgi:hypothetical protein
MLQHALGALSLFLGNALVVIREDIQQDAGQLERRTDSKLDNILDVFKFRGTQILQDGVVFAIVQFICEFTKELNSWLVVGNKHLKIIFHDTSVHGSQTSRLGSCKGCRTQNIPWRRAFLASQITDMPKWLVDTANGNAFDNRHDCG